MPATSSRWPASRKSRTGDTLCDPQKPVILEKMEFPDPVIEIAIEPKTKADQEKLGVALREARGRGSVLPRLDRSGIRPDHPQGHGRAAPRHQGRHPEAHLQGRSQCRRAAGRLSRDDHASRSTDRLHAQEADRRLRPVRAREDRRRADCAGHGLRVRERGRRRLGAEGIHPRRREGPRSRCSDSGVLAGFPVVDFKVDADRRRLPRRRLVGAGLRDRGARGVARGAAEGRPGAARADHEGRGGDARGLYRLASSATSIRGAARSRARTCAATPRSSTRWCRSPTCSATSTTCAR